MQPFDYRQQIANPFEQALGSAMQGFQLGAGIRQAQMQQQQAVQAQERQQQLMEQFARLQEKPDRSWEDYEAIANLLPKDQAEALRKNYELLSTERQEAAKRFNGQIVAALLSPNPEAQQKGIELLRRRAEAERNAGNTQEAEAYELHARIAETEGGTRVVADEIMTYGTSVFGKDWADGILKIRETPEAGFRPITPEERRAFGLPADVPFQISPKGEVKEIGRGPLVQVAVDTGAGFGPVPSGYERVVDPVTGRTIEREIPGGAGERARVQAEQEAMARAETITRAGQTLIRDATTAIQTIDKYGRRAAGIGSVLSRFPETAAMELQIDIDSIKGNIAIDSLLKIKESGAGLGAIPQAQLEALAGLLGSLDTRSSPAKLRANLLDIKRLYEDIVEKEGGDPFRLAAQRGFNFDAPARRTGVQQFVPQQQPQQRQQTAPQQGGVRFLGFE